MEKRVMNCRTYPAADWHRSSWWLWKSGWLKERQHSIPPLNLEELKEEKAVQFAAEVTNRFTASKAAQDELTPEDLWKGIKTVLLEVAREMTGSVK